MLVSELKINGVNFGEGVVSNDTVPYVDTTNKSFFFKKMVVVPGLKINGYDALTSDTLPWDVTTINEEK